MSELISGKEAWIAKSENKDVEWRLHGIDWSELTKSEFMAWDTSRFLGETKYKFRLKPKTIMLNGIEIPAPNSHKPSDGYSVWWLDDSARFKQGYHGSENFIGDDDDSWAFGWWDSKHKIEQVVAALRSIFIVK